MKLSPSSAATALLKVPAVEVPQCFDVDALSAALSSGRKESTAIAAARPEIFALE
jgi:hypothetical protein